MTPIDFNALAQQCAPGVDITTLRAVVRIESNFNPLAIGVVGGRLVRQPTNRSEAVATVTALEAAGWNYSMGLSQVNHVNLARYRLNANTVFDPCANLRTGSAILADCYNRASTSMGTGQAALRAAFSCYYSGNFRRGFVRDAGTSSYVQRVVSSQPSAPPTTEEKAIQPIPVVPAATPETADARVPSIDPEAETTSTNRDAPGAMRRPPTERPHQSWDTFGDF
jgi:type IV secretion system protein VirB1